MTVSAVILPDNTIAAVIMADSSKDPVPKGYPDGTILVAAPEGCNEEWTYNPIDGFKMPNYLIPNTLLTRRVDF